jgi:hypothetical protein
MSSNTTIRNGSLFCLNCGKMEIIPMPIEILKMTSMMNDFQKKHDGCENKWQQPMPDENMTEEEKALFWFHYGEHGTSSMTIYSALAPHPLTPMIHPTKYHHPLDPDDFSRCYLLLKMIPEWRNKLIILKQISDVWSNIIDNWDELCEMMEDQINGKENKMYSYMKLLGC